MWFEDYHYYPCLIVFYLQEETKTNLWVLYIFFSELRFSGVTFTLVPSVDPESLIDEDKGYVTESVYL